MRLLGNPSSDDVKIISGESGAGPIGCVAEIMRDPRLTHLKEALKLNNNSVVLFFSTEGDTDKESYK